MVEHRDPSVAQNNMVRETGDTLTSMHACMHARNTQRTHEQRERERKTDRATAARERERESERAREEQSAG